MTHLDKYLAVAVLLSESLELLAETAASIEDEELELKINAFAQKTENVFLGIIEEMKDAAK